VACNFNRDVETLIKGHGQLIYKAVIFRKSGNISEMVQCIRNIVTTDH